MGERLEHYGVMSLAHLAYGGKATMSSAACLPRKG
jgi:hypothetical protein